MLWRESDAQQCSTEPGTPEAAPPGHAAGKSLNRSEPFWLGSSLPLRGQARCYKVFINLSAGPAPRTVSHLRHPLQALAGSEERRLERTGI